MKWTGGTRLALHNKSNKYHRYQQWKSFKLARFRLACSSMIKYRHQKDVLTQPPRKYFSKKTKHMYDLSQDLQFYQSLQNLS
ncbi:unnamed protein product [Absidia cylindrospora]